MLIYFGDFYYMSVRLLFSKFVAQLLCGSVNWHEDHGGCHDDN